MQIHGIHATNFRLHADTSITVPSGVVGVIGSNETGKSTILEAVLWALFGTKATRGTKDSLRWHGAPERRGAHVMLEFEVGGTGYRIERGESNAKLALIGGPKTVLAEGTSGVDEFVPQLLGMTHDEFRASFLCSQKDLGRLASMGPTERQTFIRQVLGVGRIDEALTACRKRKNELSSEVEGMDAGLGSRSMLVEVVDAAAAEVLTWESTLEANRERLQQAEAAFSTAEVERNTSDARATEHRKLQAAQGQAEKERFAAAAEIERLQERLDATEKAKARIKEAEPELIQLQGLREKRDSLREAQAQQELRETLVARARQLDGEVAHEEEMIEDARHQIEAYDADAHEKANRRAGEADRQLAELRDARQKRRADARARAAALTAEIEKLDAQIARLRDMGAEAECPTCTRVLGDDLEGVVHELLAMSSEKDSERIAAESVMEYAMSPSEKEDAAEIERDESEAELETWEQAKADAQRAHEAVARREEVRHRLEQERESIDLKMANLPDVAFDADALKETENRIQRLENLDRGLVSARGLASQEASARAELQRWRERHEAADEKVTECEAELDLFGFDQEAHEAAVLNHKASLAARDTARLAVARSEETLKSKREMHERAVEEMRRYDERAEALEAKRADLTLHLKAEAGLADFRVAIAGTIRPELEELMSGFVHILTDGRHEAVTLSEDFAPTLIEAGVPTEVVSGGTEDVAALAMRLAISQMIAERAGHPIECLVLDEPFGSLDEVRRGNVLNLIRRLRGIFEQVVVISHVAETRDAVDHVVELEFDEAEACTKVVHVAAPAMEVA